MTRSTSGTPHEASAPAYRVEAPRASDAIALALRDAYDREPKLPDDMTALLRQLNRGAAH